MKRRNFIKILLGISLLVFLRSLFFLDFDYVVKKIIAKATQKLKLDDRHIDLFIKEANAENYWNQFSFVKKVFITIHYILENRFIRMPYAAKYVQYKDQIIGQFLLSTDFFFNKMDVNREINYHTFYNPYKAPCGVPFANYIT